MRYGVADSALKHGVAYGAILEVVRTGDYIGADQEKLLWWLGQAGDGEGYEVAGFVTDGGEALVLIHAFPMKWRKR